MKMQYHFLLLGTLILFLPRAGFATSKESAYADKIRISVALTEISQIHSSAAGANQVHLHSDLELNHVLRTTAGEEDTFYFNGWRIDIKPLLFDKTNNLYTVQMSVYRVIDPDTEVKLNTFTAKGSLRCQQSTCDFISGSEALLSNDQRVLAGKIKVGQSIPRPTHKLKLSKMKEGG